MTASDLDKKDTGNTHRFLQGDWFMKGRNDHEES